MHLPLLHLLSLACLASAQYFSAGWQPGQPVPRAQASVPQAQEQKASGGLLGSLSGLLEKAGLNITAAGPGWDERVPLLTDANYEEMVVNEEMAPEEEDERVWFIVVTVTSGQSEGLSKYTDQAFDAAFNESLVEGDLPHVRWGRIDYLNVTGITTRWNVWQAPLYVLATARGHTLRFYKPRALRPHAPTLRAFLLSRAYLATPPWASPFAPGGPRAWALEYLAVVLTRVYEVMVRVPRWALVLVTGASGSVVLNLFHRKPKGGQAQKRVVRTREKQLAPKVEKVAEAAKTEKAIEAARTEKVVEAPKTAPKKTRGKRGGKK